MFKEFKEFAMRGNVLDMAVGIIIGVSFSAIVKSMVDDVIMPPIGLILGDVDFANLFLVLKDGATVAAPYVSLAEAQTAGAVTINYGVFISSLVSFVLMAFSVFLLIRTMNRLKRQETAPPPAATTRDCPFCFSAIPLKASRCPYCTSEVKPV